MKKLGMLALMGILGLGMIIPCYAEKIVVEGSTTVLPIAQKAAEVYMIKILAPISRYAAAVQE